MMRDTTTRYLGFAVSELCVWGRSGGEGAPSRSSRAVRTANIRTIMAARAVRLLGLPGPPGLPGVLRPAGEATAVRATRVCKGRVLRFWLTPGRKRVCSCGSGIGDLAKHLLFHCSNTHLKTAAYASRLEPQLISSFAPNKLMDFLRKVVRTEKLLENLNMFVGTFEYPRY